MAGSLSGYVVRAERAEASATVTIVDGPGSFIDLALVTDADGWFSLDDLAAGSWTLRATATDGATSQATVELWDNSLSEMTIDVAGATSQSPDIWLVTPSPDAQDAGIPTEDRTSYDAVGWASPAIIVGQVTDSASGAPVANALVMVTDGPGPLVDMAVRTDIHGYFAVPAVEAGNWGLRAYGENGSSGEALVAVESNRRCDVTITLVRGDS
ncbi:MAG: carboxypeptidase-like regulatory domain-containing protein [Acidimicrobiia bacterium]